MNNLNKDILSLQPKSPMQKAMKLVELQRIYKEIKPEIDALKAELLEITQKLDVITLKTGAYTISRAKRITPQVVDFKLLKKTLDKEEIPYETEEVFDDRTMLMFKEAIREHRELDGLEGKETEYISIRVKEEKHG